MRAVGIKVLKNRLSEFVRLAAAGETVLVTDRERVVAQLGPPPPERADALPDALLADAVRQGLITPAALPPGGRPPAPPPVMSLCQLLGELEQAREDR
jgi:antitoxin (DNA-binding transcriptional repressor) of toxin-antitoxin stability system